MHFFRPWLKTCDFKDGNHLYMYTMSKLSVFLWSNLPGHSAWYKCYKNMVETWENSSGNCSYLLYKDQSRMRTKKSQCKLNNLKYQLSYYFRSLIILTIKNSPKLDCKMIPFEQLQLKIISFLDQIVKSNSCEIVLKWVTRHSHQNFVSICQC